jgi:hypothetical protein
LGVIHTFHTRLHNLRKSDIPTHASFDGAVFYHNSMIR